MRKGRDGGKTGEKKKKGEKKEKIRMKIVVTTSLPAVDGPNADCWNAARSLKNLFKLNTFDLSLVNFRRHIFRPCLPFCELLAANLNFADGATLNAECRCRI